MLSLSLFTEEVILAEDDDGTGNSINVPVWCCCYVMPKMQ